MKSGFCWSWSLCNAWPARITSTVSTCTPAAAAVVVPVWSCLRSLTVLHVAYGFHKRTQSTTARPHSTCASMGAWAALTVMLLEALTASCRAGAESAD